MPLTGKVLYDFIQQNARKFALEGSVQAQLPHTIKIIVVGTHEAIESFIDILHKESLKRSITDLEVEPFLKDRDYRGIFRVIE